SDIQKYSIQSVSLTVDVTQENQVHEMVRKTVDTFSRIDLLVYNAGVAKSAKITDFQLNDWEKALNINLTGYFLCAREVSKVMVKQGYGNIIQINSKSGKVG